MISVYDAAHHHLMQSELRALVAQIKAEGLVILPTDTGYRFACMLGQARPLRRLRLIRQLEIQHDFTLICRDLSELGTYANVPNPVYRMLKRHTPGPYTFILNATPKVPKLTLHPKKRSIGIRVSDHPVLNQILDALDAPILSSTLELPNADGDLDWPGEIIELCCHTVDAIVNVGFCPSELTTVVDCTSGVPDLIRQGAGDIDELH